MSKLTLNTFLIFTLAYLLNPQSQLARARNFNREYGLTKIRSALMVYKAPDHEKKLPESIKAICPNTQVIGKSDVDLEFGLRNYFSKDFPYDPKEGNAENTGYTICLDNGRIHLEAPRAELKRKDKPQ